MSGKPLRDLIKDAERGDARAACNLGVMYATGSGVTQDYKEAVKWYRLVAEQGHAAGQLNLGSMYFNGEGVTQDHNKAVEWYLLAAEQGDAMAQCNLGVMYDYGLGVPEDNLTAYAWYSIAASKGIVDGRKTEDFITKEMSHEQIAEAQKLSRELVKQIEERQKKAE